MSYNPSSPAASCLPCLLLLSFFPMELVVSYLPWLQIGLSVLLIAAILLQHTGAGLGGAFGGTETAGYTTRRGFERFLFIATIVLAVLFAASAFLALVV